VASPRAGEVVPPFCHAESVEVTPCTDSVFGALFTVP